MFANVVAKCASVNCLCECCCCQVLTYRRFCSIFARVLVADAVFANSDLRLVVGVIVVCQINVCEVGLKNFCSWSHLPNCVLHFCDCVRFSFVIVLGELRLWRIWEGALGNWRR